jgi:hypothetical protein
MSDGSGGGSTKQTFEAKAHVFINRFLGDGGPKRECTLGETIGDLFEYEQ